MHYLTIFTKKWYFLDSLLQFLHCDMKPTLRNKKGDLIWRNGVVVSNSGKDFRPHPNLRGTSEVHWCMLHHNNSDSQKSDFGLESVLELVMDSCCYVWSLLPCSSCPHWCGLGCTWLRTSCMQVFICWWVIPVSSFSRLFSSHRGSHSGKGALTSPDGKAL